MLAPKLGLLLAFLSAAGCTSSGLVRSVAPTANKSTVVERSLDGTVTLRSLQTHIVSVIPMKNWFSPDTFLLPTFHVIVTNGGKENISLKRDDISAYSGDGNVKLLSPDALQDRLDGEQLAAGGSKGGYSSAQDASQPAAEPHGYHKNNPIPSSAQSRGVPAGALDFKVPSRFRAGALRPQVIRPGEAGGGHITLEAEHILSGLPLKIVVAVGGEKHEFLFDVRY